VLFAVSKRVAQILAIILLPMSSETAFTHKMKQVLQNAFIFLYENTICHQIVVTFSLYFSTFFL